MVGSSYDKKEIFKFLKISFLALNTLKKKISTGKIYSFVNHTYFNSEMSKRAKLSINSEFIFKTLN